MIEAFIIILEYSKFSFLNLYFFFLSMNHELFFLFEIYL